MKNGINSLLACWEQLLSVSKRKAVMSSFETIIGNWICLFSSPSASQNKMTSRGYSEFSSLSLFLGVHITFLLSHPGDPSISSLPACPFRKSLLSGTQICHVQNTLLVVFVFFFEVEISSLMGGLSSC